MNSNGARPYSGRGLNISQSDAQRVRTRFEQIVVQATARAQAIRQVDRDVYEGNGKWKGERMIPPSAQQVKLPSVPLQALRARRWMSQGFSARKLQALRARQHADSILESPKNNSEPLVSELKELEKDFGITTDDEVLQDLSASDAT